MNDFPRLSRRMAGASVSAEVPIASADRAVLGFLGMLSANGTVGVSDVSGFGQLVSANFGLSWSLISDFGRVHSADAEFTVSTSSLRTIALPNDFAKHMHPDQLAFVGAQLQFNVDIAACARSILQCFGQLRSGIFGIKCNRFFQCRLMREVCFNNVVNLF